jgi:hypothetical protein
MFLNSLKITLIIEHSIAKEIEQGAKMAVFRISVNLSISEVL